MCGIIGYVGEKKASEIIFEALRRIEYRGYDSAGIAVVDEGRLLVLKGEGRLDDINSEKNFLSLDGNIGIGHTRWATHGPPCERNAHPHTDEEGRVAIVHNGIIENFSELRTELEEAGVTIKSDTDTELVAHLISREMKKTSDVLGAVRKVVLRLKGTYSLGILVQGEDRLFLARKYSPLVIGKGSGEMFFASDIPALLEHTKDFVLLQDGDLAEINSTGYRIIDSSGVEQKREEIHVDWDAQMAQKGGYSHFMLKEIYEQPNTLLSALSADVSEAAGILKSAKKIAVIGCGTSYYAGLVLENLLSKCGFNCRAFIASEYKAWSPRDEDVVLAISQSGETADTLSALRSVKKRGAKIIALTNVVGSSMTREADSNLYLGVGPEIGVLATKSFTGQLVILYKIAFALCENLDKINLLNSVPDNVKEILEVNEGRIKEIANSLVEYKDFFFIGRGISNVAGLEGALKLKEVTYLHAESYAAGELKHGPISLLQDDVVVFAIAPSGEYLEKMKSNIQECKARGAKIIVMSDDEEALSSGDYSIKMPKFDESLVVLYYVICLQLLAYFMAVKLGRDADKPRNLAKSVTVE